MHLPSLWHNLGEYTILGLAQGAIYALFALGYTLVFGVLDILNLAHAAVFMLASFVALVLVSDLHLHVLVALPCTMAFAGLLGLLLERVAFRPLRSRADSNIAGLISSLAAATVVMAVLVALEGGLVPRVRPAFRPFAVAGLLYGSAYAFLLTAFDRGRVTVVAPLYATESLWAVVIGALVLRRSEDVSLRLFAAALLVVAGGALIGGFR